MIPFSTSHRDTNVDPHAESTTSAFTEVNERLHDFTNDCVFQLILLLENENDFVLFHAEHREQRSISWLVTANDVSGSGS